MKKCILFVAILLMMPAAVMALDIEAVLCNQIEERMPVGEGDQFGSDVERVYLWTRVTGAETELTLRHVWLYEGKEIADVALTVKGSPWRTYSYKSMIPKWTGSWEVKVVGETGDVLLSKTFTVVDKKAVKKVDTPQKDIQVNPNAAGGATDEKATPVDSTKKKVTTPR